MCFFWGATWTHRNEFFEIHRRSTADSAKKRRFSSADSNFIANGGFQPLGSERGCRVAECQRRVSLMFLWPLPEKDDLFS